MKERGRRQIKRRESEGSGKRKPEKKARRGRETREESEMAVVDEEMKEGGKEGTRRRHMRKKYEDMNKAATMR